ncbi:hypothetical protein DPMN_025849 [Dreissena polymorpha]|uniref:Uncharacterized protein n=3 Tax=Dreissena polymorpha TaxID=45954 RepID=A0A9D4RC76_DREPO|nr:hypothetical protein DPMN_025849 [Dreissena polymorpha]
MEVKDDERKECCRVEQATGKTVCHTRDCEQADLFNELVTLENSGEHHLLVIENESRQTGINNVETENSDKNCGTEATSDITMQTTRLSTDSSLKNISSSKNIQIKTADFLSVINTIDQENKIHFPATENRKAIPDEKHIAENRNEICMTIHTTTLNISSDFEKDDSDEYRKDGCDVVDGLGKLVKQKVKTLIVCASSKGMTVDDDSLPFQKANKEKVDENGDNLWVNSPLYGKETEINTCTTVVRESEEKVSRVSVGQEECGPFTVASTVFTSELTETTKETCHFFLPSQLDETKTQSAQTVQISNTKCHGNGVLLVDPYYFNRGHRGYMIIIVNQTFNHQAFRDGAHKDVEYLYNIAYKLRLTVYKGKNTNMSFTETKQLLEDVRCLDHSDSDMLALGISTHGLEQPNPNAKGKSDHALVCSDDRMIFTSTITEMFSDDNCPSLKDKPKLFIIQACRGEEHDSGADLSVAKKIALDRTCGGNAETCWQPCLDDSDVHFAKDSWATGPDNQGQPVQLHDDLLATTGNESFALPMVPQFTSTQLVREQLGSSPHLKPFPFVDTPSLKCENNQLVFYAIPPGMFAWRNTEDGSWMLYYLNNLIEMCDDRRPINMLKLLLKVNAVMARRTTNVPSDKNLDKKKAISVVEHKLTRDLIFPPLVK